MPLIPLMPSIVFFLYFTTKFDLAHVNHSAFDPAQLVLFHYRPAISCVHIHHGKAYGVAGFVFSADFSAEGI